MAFGSGDPADPGSWSQKPPKERVDPPEPPAEQEPPPATPSPAAAPLAEEIDDAYVVGKALASLPSEDDFRVFGEFRSTALPEIVQAVIRQSGLDDQGDFVQQMKHWITSVQNAEK